METSLKQPITTVKVGAVRLRLDDRDLQILHLLDEHKFLTTQQVAKFMHAPSRMFASSVRLASRKMSSLQEAKLITAGGLRRVGGIGQGSEPYVWHLAKLGYDALAKLRTTETGLVKRPYKAPTYTFANHRVAINDTKLLFRHITERHEAMRLGKVLLEEKSWRSYVSVSGKDATIRPDLYVETYRGDVKHHWFVEVDLDTESPVRIIDKCRNYLDYLASSTPNDWCCGEFPAVLWVMPTVKRRDSIRRHIAESLPFVPENQLFLVITAEELKGLVVDGKLGELEEVSYE